MTCLRCDGFIVCGPNPDCGFAPDVDWCDLGKVVDLDGSRVYVKYRPGGGTGPCACEAKVEAEAGADPPWSQEGYLEGVEGRFGLYCKPGNPAENRVKLVGPLVD